MTKRIILFLIFFLVSDLYFYQAVLTLAPPIWIRVGYWAVDLLLVAGLISLTFLAKLQHKI